MTYSYSDFADDVVTRLADIGALDATLIPENDPSVQASLALTAIEALRRGPLAARFASEVLDTVESLSELAEQHGIAALADLFYLQTAILDGTFVQLDSGAAPISNLVRTLPSASEWGRYMQFLEVGERPA